MSWSTLRLKLRSDSLKGVALLSALMIALWI
ncbi:unnamed protein product [Acanthoscelides obtectus]|uniref:Uncharacterized protein n=1 Tax=Acanthoscelides obtectus TaxID=200917 RepID=A0A9P0Q609_ACAOB|nr:unnamed protein product [Acanthoscelides obtectus]CAK1640876.1 hypothetical protein AOBTE_LOCUS11990 [Acanthoscelides obtectus]